jgi:O-antigen ligase/tetratricopeptide (TPR) repeat protein
VITRDETPAVRTVQTVRTAGVVLLLALVAISPWPFGSANPSGQFAVALAILALVGLWTAHAFLARQVRYRSDAVAACLLGLVIFTALQLIPLPEGVVRFLSPTVVEWNRALIPETPELLPGETESDVPRRSSWLRLSVAPAASEDLLVQFLAVYLIYAAATNFALDRHSLTRLAWVGFATGVALALAALTQYLSGDRERIYGRFEAAAVVFGPFVNKNHFSFQMHLFIGLAAGLFLRVARRDGLHSPLVAGLVGGLGLMFAAVAFSQSRGGIIALLAAAVVTGLIARLCRARNGTDARLDRRIGLALLAGVLVTAIALIAWLGWGRVLDRFASLWQGTADNRTHIWTRGWRLVGLFPITGTGAGGYSAAELATRTVYDGTYLSVSAHNEYLEALIEGGVLRLALTIGLAVGAIGAAARRYHRSGDPLLLGCVFALLALAIHSIGDFGIHVPSVAIAAAVVAAWSRGQETGDRRQETGLGNQEKEITEGTGEPSGHHPAFVIVFLLAALLVVAANWRAWRIDRFRSAAGAAPRAAGAVQFLEAATRVRPDDPEVWEELAFAHLLAAAESSAVPLGLGGQAETLDIVPGSDPGGHVTAALKAARAGRNIQPLAAGQHLRLGRFADRFARGEPAHVHLDRAKRVNSVEPDVWYVCGMVEADRGDWDTALADWRESLARSPRRLAPIGRAAAGRVPPGQFRARTLPDDPVLWFAVAPQLFPDAAAPGRADWLRAIDTRYSRHEPESVAGFLAWGSTLEELSNSAAAIRAWRRALERFPNDLQLHDRLAARLETDEFYAEALPILEWLTGREPDRGDFRHRLAATKHALKLKAEIDGP